MTKPGWFTVLSFAFVLTLVSTTSVRRCSYSYPNCAAFCSHSWGYGCRRENDGDPYCCLRADGRPSDCKEKDECQKDCHSKVCDYKVKHGYECYECTGLTKGQLAGIIVGVILFVVLIIVVVAVWCCYMMRRPVVAAPVVEPVVMAPPPPPFPPPPPPPMVVAPVPMYA